MVADPSTGCFDVDSFLVDIVSCDQQDCNPNSDITILNSPIAANTYHYRRVTSSTRVAVNTEVILKGVEFIRLLPGFHAEAGSQFTAMIEACPATLIESESLLQTTPDNQLKEDLGQELPVVKVFPNPTAYQANINLTLPVAETVQLDLFDLSGKRVTNLVREVTLPAGVHHYQWQCDQVEAGMYLIVLNGRVVNRIAVVR